MNFDQLLPNFNQAFSEIFMPIKALLLYDRAVG
jgi:hypothetical protein